MFTINRQIIDNVTRTKDSKRNPGKNLPVLYDSFKKIVWNNIDLTSDFSEYEMAHWTNNIDRWVNNRATENTTTYKRGRIINIDLGAVNFRFEPSFAHPCIVLINRHNTILVAPCSSKKYGRKYHDVIDAEISDGFKKQTGIQIESIRWVHKNRVISVVGKATPNIMKAIDNHLLSIIPEYKKEQAQMDLALKENIELKEMLELLNLENDELKEEVRVLNKKEEA